MLVLPLRSPQHPRVRHEQDDAAAYTTSHQGPQSLKPTPASNLQRQAGDTMMAMMPTTRPPMPKRPKLSLQTSDVASSPAGQKSRTALNVTVVTQSPMYANTYTNVYDCPSASFPSTPSEEKASPQSSPEDRSSPGSSHSSVTTSTSCHTSPFPSTTPYCLPLGPRSILRNSPIPRRSVSATSIRTPKLLFPRTKQVCFRERVEEFIPIPLRDETPDASEISDADSSEKRLQDEIAERKTLDDLLEEETATAYVHGRRKRRREWIWRPLEDDILSPRYRDAPAMEGAKGSLSSDRPVPELRREQSISEIPQSPRDRFVSPVVSKSVEADSQMTIFEKQDRG